MVYKLKNLRQVQNLAQVGFYTVRKDSFGEGDKKLLNQLKFDRQRVLHRNRRTVLLTRRPFWH